MGLQSEHMAAEVCFVGSCVLSGLISLLQLALRGVFILLGLAGYELIITNEAVGLAGHIYQLISGARGGGTHLNGLYRYVPRNRVWFLEVLDP